jgi:hypothetical protein
MNEFEHFLRKENGVHLPPALDITGGDANAPHTPESAPTVEGSIGSMIRKVRELRELTKELRKLVQELKGLINDVRGLILALGLLIGAIILLIHVFG